MGPGDRAFLRYAKRYLAPVDAVRVLRAYNAARIISVDNQAGGSFRFLDVHAAGRKALLAAADNLRPEGKRRRSISLTATPELWERQERVELAMRKLDAKRTASKHTS